VSRDPQECLQWSSDYVRTFLGKNTSCCLFVCLCVACGCLFSRACTVWRFFVSVQRRRRRRTDGQQQQQEEEAKEKDEEEEDDDDDDDEEEEEEKEQHEEEEE
jgi:hypothetical protein